MTFGIAERNTVKLGSASRTHANTFRLVRHDRQVCWATSLVFPSHGLSKNASTAPCMAFSKRYAKLSDKANRTQP